MAVLCDLHPQSTDCPLAGELSMGVRSSVTRAEKILYERMKNDKNLRKQWEKIKMQQISS